MEASNIYFIQMESITTREFYFALGRTKAHLLTSQSNHQEI